MDDFIDEGFLAGFGWSANFTYSPSTSKERDFYGVKLPLSDNSERQANLALWYDKDGLQARLAYNYRSERFISTRSLNERSLARMAKPTGFLDASISYDVLDFLTASIQLTNITEESQEEYFQWEDLVDKRFYNERRVNLGVQAKF